MITIRNLCKEFKGDSGSFKVIKNINFHIGDDDFITIMGPSGGGKSTLLQILGGLTSPTDGEIDYNGDILDYKNEKLLNKYRRENIGFIFQNSNLISSLSPAENLIIAMNSNESYKEKKKRAKSLLESVGLAKRYNVNVSSLSGGEAQRVAIVRALVNNPKIILCDEPTGALDSENSNNVLNILMNIKKERKCTLIIVTHDNNIGKLGERQIFLRDGEINEMV